MYAVQVARCVRNKVCQHTKGYRGKIKDCNIERTRQGWQCWATEIIGGNAHNGSSQPTCLDPAMTSRVVGVVVDDNTEVDGDADAEDSVGVYIKTKEIIARTYTALWFTKCCTK